MYNLPILTCRMPIVPKHIPQKFPILGQTAHFRFHPSNSKEPNRQDKEAALHYQNKSRLPHIRKK